MKCALHCLLWMARVNKQVNDWVRAVVVCCCVFQTTLNNVEVSCEYVQLLKSNIHVSNRFCICFPLFANSCLFSVADWCVILSDTNSLNRFLWTVAALSYTDAGLRCPTGDVIHCCSVQIPHRWRPSAGAPQVISYTGALCRCPAVDVVSSGWCYLEKYSLVERLSSYVCSCLGMLPRDSWALCWLFGCVSVCRRTK